MISNILEIAREQGRRVKVLPTQKTPHPDFDRTQAIVIHYAPVLYWIYDFLATQSNVIWFFPESDEKSLLFEDGLDFYYVVNRCAHGFDITVPDLSFYVRWEMGATYFMGTAAEWLKGQFNQIYDRLGLPPATLKVKGVQVDPYTNVVKFDCLYALEQPFQILFTVTGFHWSAYPQGDMEFVFLGTRHGSSEIGVIKAANFLVELFYKELRVEKGE